MKPLALINGRIIGATSVNADTLEGLTKKQFHAIRAEIDKATGGASGK